MTDTTDEKCRTKNEKGRKKNAIVYKNEMKDEKDNIKEE